MNKSVLTGVGILLFIIGLIMANFAGRALITDMTITKMFSHLYIYLIEAVIAIVFMVLGGILVFVGIKKS